jgi:hypothetical protein
MEFDFYIELGSRTTDHRITDLLRFPADFALQRGEWAVQWWAHGKIKRLHAAHREGLLHRLVASGVNELDLKWRSVEPIFFHGVKVVSAQLLFCPSPMSDLWALVPTAKLSSRTEDRSRRNFLNTESVLRDNYRLPYPSTLECFLKLATPRNQLSDAELQEISLNWVRSVIPEPLAAQGIFGYGCVHGNCRRKPMTVSMGGEPAWMDQLGEKFESVYPLLIGPLASCEGLAQAFGGRGKVIQISSASPSAIVSIDPDDVKAASQDAAVKAWLVDRPASRNLLGPRIYVVPPQKASAKTN